MNRPSTFSFAACLHLGGKKNKPEVRETNKHHENVQKRQLPELATTVNRLRIFATGHFSARGKRVISSKATVLKRMGKPVESNTLVLPFIPAPWYHLGQGAPENIGHFVLKHKDCQPHDVILPAEIPNANFICRNTEYFEICWAICKEKETWRR